MEFQNIPVLRNINFGIKKGETISICGASGSGKTTLINILGLLESPTCGDVLWNGENVTHEKISRVAKLRAKIFGYVFQQCNLIPELNVLENLLFPRRIVAEITEVDTSFARNLLAQVGLVGVEKRDTATLSGGERQRVAAARAMMNHPDIIIADEPTGSLDTRASNLVMDMMVNLCKSSGSTLLLLTHNPIFAKNMEQSYVIDNGTLRAS
jgi:ABC-type lipoprotein export system ATPase subunit